MSNKRIFISYRRSDSAGHAGRLHDYLKNYFGDNRIFFDVDTIEVGANFEQKIAAELDNSDAVLVLIGNHWLNAEGADENRRLDDPHDYVRLEVETALGRDITVIPILLQDSQMPSGSALPDTLSDLALRNAIRLNDDHWRSDCGLLAGVLKKALNVSRSLKEAETRRFHSIVIALSALAALFSVVDISFFRDTPAAFGDVLRNLSLVFPIMNIGFVTYLLGSIKDKFDRLCWAIVSLATVGGYMSAVGGELIDWVPVTMIVVAGLLNFVEPDE
jgi:hypothetical protein